MDSLKDILKDNKDLVKEMTNRHKYVTKEFQDYGYRMAIKLGEKDRASLFIKLAKTKPRAFLDQAYSFAIDYPNARHRGRIFLWRLKELEAEYKASKEEVKEGQIGMFADDAVSSKKPKAKREKKGKSSKKTKEKTLPKSKTKKQVIKKTKKNSDTLQSSANNSESTKI